MPLPIGDEALGLEDDGTAGLPPVNRPEYDLDGHILPKVPEDPWGEHPRTPPVDEPN